MTMARERVRECLAFEQAVLHEEAAEKGLPERENAARKEGLQHAGERNKCAIL